MPEDVLTIPDLNLFMMCPILNPAALSDLPEEYHIRTCRKKELELWKGIHFDNPDDAQAYQAYMTDFFANVYAPKGDLFYKKCLFICDRLDTPIGTGFIWQAYDEFNTIHWLKVVKAYEGKGIGRGLMSVLMRDLEAKDYPVYLHTQPGSFRAIKLYSDFGFKLLADPIIGSRKNDLEECLPILENLMPATAYKSLQITNAPATFISRLKNEKINAF